MLKNELKRAFTSKGMLLSLVLGQGINIYYIISILSQRKTANDTMAMVEEKIGRSLYHGLPENAPFDVWLLGHVCQAYVLFMYFLPVLAALPYAATYAAEKKSGYMKNVLCRADRKKYRACKCTASFIAGGAATVSVMLLNLMWCFTYMKFRMPTPASSAPLVWGKTMLGVMYYSHPFIYSFIYLLAVFVFSGAMSLASIIISEITTNIFTVLLTPFLVIMIFNTILTEESGSYLPIQFLRASNSGYKLYMAPIVSGILIIVTIFLFVFAGRRKDAL